MGLCRMACHRWGQWTINGVAMGLVLWSLTAFAVGDELSFRGTRFCEVVYLHKRQILIFDTTSLNNCPAALWRQLSVHAIKQKTNSMYAYLNGPRRFTVDGVQFSNGHNRERQQFGRIQMYKVGFLQPTLQDYVVGDRAYHEHHIYRETTWTYRAGKPVYELIDPQGQVYMMYSYTVTRAQHNESDLTQLDKYVALPQNWRFKTGILSRDVVIKPNRQMFIVIQDGLRNSYQKVTRDYLKS